MKKSLSLLVAIAMVFSMFASVAFAADNATEKTTQEKYDALVAAKIFNGFPDGEAHLDDNMTRAQAAKIVALLTGYTDGTSVADAGFTDLAGATWAKAYINYVASLQIVNGVGNNKFAPSDEVTTEQLAKMVILALNTLGQDVPDGDAVDGTVSDWAKGYVAAAVKAGLLPAQEDYTTSATRELLVVSAYTAYEAAMAAQAPMLDSAMATGVKKIDVKFTGAVDDSKATFAVKKGNAVSNVSKITFNDAKTVATLETSVALTAGDYTVTVGGLGFETGKDVATFSVTPERIESVWVDSNAYRTATIGTTGSTTVEVAIKLLNQYSEEVSAGVAGSVYATSTVGATTVSTDKKKVTITGVADTINTFNLTVVDAKFAKSTTETVTVQLFKSINEVTLGSVEIPTGKTTVEADTTVTLPYTAKDQYGNDMTLSSLAGLTFIPSDAALITNIALTADKKKIQFKLEDFNGPKTLTLQVIVNATGKSSKIEFTANGKKNISSVTLVAPTTQFGQGETAYKVEVQAVDQYGNALNADEIIARQSELVVTAGNPGVFAPTNSTTPISKDGDKAVIQLTGSSKGTAILIVSVKSNAFNTNVSLTVVDAKYAASLAIDASVTKAVYQASLTVKATFTDQYGNPYTSGSAAVVAVESDNTDFGGTVATQSVSNLKDNGIVRTAGGHDKTTVVTFKLYDTAANALANNGTGLLDSTSVTLKSVKQDAALTYEIDALGTLAAKADGHLDSDYAKEVKVVGKDSSGDKVALKSDAIQTVTAVDSSILAVGTDAGKWKVAVLDGKEGDTAVNVTIAKQDGSLVVQQAAVKASKAAPVAVSITGKKGDDAVTKATIAQVNGVDLFTKNSNVWFEVKDQYGTTAMGNSADVALFVTNNAGVMTKLSTTTVDFNAAGTWKVTAVSGDKTATVEVTVQ